MSWLNILYFKTWPLILGTDCKVVHAKMNSNFSTHCATNHIQKTCEFSNVTFKQINSNIFKLCDNYFSCKDIMSILHKNEKSKSNPGQGTGHDHSS